MHRLEETVREMVWKVLFPIKEDSPRSEIIFRAPSKRVSVQLIRCYELENPDNLTSIEVCVYMDSKHEDKNTSWKERESINVEGLELGLYHEGCKNFDMIVYSVVRCIRVLWGEAQQ